MSPRTVTFERQVWNSKELTGLKVTPGDAENGVLISINRGTLNSILISSLMGFLAKAQEDKVVVEVTTDDELTLRSLEHCGVPRLASLTRGGTAKYQHATDQGPNPGAEKPTGTPADGIKIG